MQIESPINTLEGAVKLLYGIDLPIALEKLKKKEDELKGLRPINELSETEKYWARRNHVELDLMNDQEQE